MDLSWWLIYYSIFVKLSGYFVFFILGFGHTIRGTFCTWEFFILVFQANTNNNWEYIPKIYSLY